MALQQGIYTYAVGVLRWMVAINKRAKLEYFRFYGQ